MYNYLHIKHWIAHCLVLQRSLEDWRQERLANLGQQAAGPPKTLVFFRDGVSEGEFDQVAQHEIAEIRGQFFALCSQGLAEAQHVDAFKEIGILPTKWPRIVFIVVTKRYAAVSDLSPVCETLTVPRHHVRFFAKQ